MAKVAEGMARVASEIGDGRLRSGAYSQRKSKLRQRIAGATSSRF